MGFMVQNTRINRHEGVWRHLSDGAPQQHCNTVKDFMASLSVRRGVLITITNHQNVDSQVPCVQRRQ